jgi:hypothetical protein
MSGCHLTWFCMGSRANSARNPVPQERGAVWAIWEGWGVRVGLRWRMQRMQKSKERLKLLHACADIDIVRNEKANPALAPTLQFQN